MTDNLKDLENWMQPLLKKLSAAERNKLARKIAVELRKSQGDRIAQQKNPDGSSFTPRKSPPAPVNKPMRFLYKKPSGEERIAEISSYQNQGDRVTGYDVEAGGLRTFIRDRMQQHMKPKSAGGPGSLRERKGAIRRSAMFSKMRLAKNLRATANDSSVLVGFVGRVADIARIHQYGLRDQVNSSGTQVRYEKRELLGFTDKDVQSVLNLLVDHLGNQ